MALACEMGAASADHCTHLAPADIDALAGSETVATLLPISDFCTRQPYPDGRALLDAGATVALASNCNPGSSYSTSIPLALALAVRECGLTIEEAILAATAGGAAALRRHDVGRLVAGRPSRRHHPRRPRPRPPGLPARGAAGGRRARGRGVGGGAAGGLTAAPRLDPPRWPPTRSQGRRTTTRQALVRPGWWRVVVIFHGTSATRTP